MKITIIGSTSYQDKMLKYKEKMEKKGHKVEIPAFDNHEKLDELGVCRHNLALIRWANEVHIFWDKRSTGTIFDFGMCFALKKSIKIIYFEKRTFEKLFRLYEKEAGKWNHN